MIRRCNDRKTNGPHVQHCGVHSWSDWVSPLRNAVATAIRLEILTQVTASWQAERLHGAFIAVDARVDALPHSQAMEFNEIQVQVLQGVAGHVASLLTHNEESTAKSALLQVRKKRVPAEGRCWQRA